jgi:transcriptional regulator with XRE-family HTH domain
VDSPIGDNLARLRHARGLTQDQLAEAAGVNVGVISRLEQHVKHGARWSTLAALASALGVQLPVLITPPALLGGHAEPDSGAELAELRHTLVRAGDLFGADDLADDADLVDPAALSRSVRQMWTAYHRGEFVLVTRTLPGLIADARRLTHAQTGDASASAHRLLSTCYSAAAGVTVMRGHPDLAWLAVERAADAASRADSPLASAAAAIFAAWILLKQGHYDDAERVALRAADQAEPSIAHASELELATFANLLINASCAAVRAGAGDRASDHLSVARAAAGRYGTDGIFQWAISGPRAVAMYEVCNAVELQDLDTALRAADRVPAPAGGALPATWEARYFLDLAFASSETGRDAEAVTLLTQALEAAPEWIGYHPLGHAVVRDQLERPRKPSEQLVALAAHLQVT